ncbi:Lrp/AsnC family transcriptional regulator [Oceanomicrobium pacificus]|uniref:Winged helix-turn-helix transcriptional regulator n=1 Tax=Oceanomicrobium pacificus TaxID=2692916 RepID=A0A6B0TW54_9RHOB|nr:Lrp/AsnC family transcriptional regulator [Oceanomicrobium pacificus]MXU65975.1 winged helix-turn-helix transcriptional regulator [Oceanomicrobium pacificus]
MHAVDDMDRKLLRILQDDPDLSTARLAEEVGLSAGACWRRIERMEAAGIIRGRETVINWRALGYEVEVYLRITLDKTETNAFDSFIRAARDVPEVTRLETLLGRVDIRMDIRARDLAHYQEIYKDRILTLPHILDIEALMLVSELKHSESLPI